jgi:hypothetical protein
MSKKVFESMWEWVTNEYQEFRAFKFEDSKTYKYLPYTMNFPVGVKIDVHEILPSMVREVIMAFTLLEKSDQEQLLIDEFKTMIGLVYEIHGFLCERKEIGLLPERMNNIVLTHCWFCKHCERFYDLATFYSNSKTGLNK